MTEPDAPRKHEAERTPLAVETRPRKTPILSYSGFRNLWVGQLISQFGDVLYALVFLWMVLEVTKSAEAVGIVGAFEALPYVLFSLYAGTIADRHDRRKLLILSDLVSAALVLGFLIALWFAPQPPLWVVCLFGFALGSANVFAAPARNAAIPRLVPPERLQEANGLNTMTQNVMPLAGNAISALALKALFSVSPALAYLLSFAVNAVTFLISAIFMARLPALLPEREDEPKSAWRDAKEGFQFVRRHPVLLPAILVELCMNFFVAPFMLAYVVVAQQKFKGSPATLALLDTGFFLGMALGSFVVSRMTIRRVGVAFTVSMALCALTVLPMGYVGSLWLFWALNLLCGLVIPLAMIPMTTLIQLETPDGLRGRVNSALGMISALVMPVGMALSGFLIELFGLSGIFLFMGIGFGACPLIGLFWRGYRTATLPTSVTNPPAVG